MTGFKLHHWLNQWQDSGDTDDNRNSCIARKQWLKRQRPPPGFLRAQVTLLSDWRAVGKFFLPSCFLCRSVCPKNHNYWVEIINKLLLRSIANLERMSNLIKYCKSEMYFQIASLSVSLVKWIAKIWDSNPERLPILDIFPTQGEVNCRHIGNLHWNDPYRVLMYYVKLSCDLFCDQTSFGE